MTRLISRSLCLLEFIERIPRPTRPIRKHYLCQLRQNSGIINEKYFSLLKTDGKGDGCIGIIDLRVAADFGAPDTMTDFDGTL